MEVQVLQKTKWVSLRRIIDPVNGTDAYDFLHEDRCSGKIVSILPYRTLANGNREYLLRSEITPPWGWKAAVSSITGGVEKDDPLETAVMEMAEEAGYEVTRDDMKFLDTSRGTKASDTTYYLYTVDLTDKEKTLSGDGDGSDLEKRAHCYWADSIEDAEDPLLYVLYYKISTRIK